MGGLQQLYNVKWEAWKGRRPSKMLKRKFLFTRCIRQGSAESPKALAPAGTTHLKECRKKLEEERSGGPSRQNNRVKATSMQYPVGRQLLGDVAFTGALEADDDRAD